MAFAIPECGCLPNENANDVVFVKKSRLIAPIPFLSTETTTMTSTATASSGGEASRAPP